MTRRRRRCQPWLAARALGSWHTTARAPARSLSPPLATAIVGGILAARGEGLGGGVGDVEPRVRHRGHADFFAHLEHVRLGHAVERELKPRLRLTTRAYDMVLCEKKLRSNMTVKHSRMVRLQTVK